MRGWLRSARDQCIWCVMHAYMHGSIYVCIFMNLWYQKSIHPALWHLGLCIHEFIRTYIHMNTKVQPAKEHFRRRPVFGSLKMGQTTMQLGPKLTLALVGLHTTGILLKRTLLPLRGACDQHTYPHAYVRTHIHTVPERIKLAYIHTYV